MAVYYTIVQYSNINQYTTTVSWLSCVIGDREKGNREMTIPGAQPPGGSGVRIIWIQIWQYIPMYPAIIPNKPYFRI